MWSLLEKFNATYHVDNGPECQAIYNHFKRLSTPDHKEYFTDTLVDTAKHYLQTYDALKNAGIEMHDNELNVINRNFTVEEIKYTIDPLKPNKAPGVDKFPAEFIKACKNQLAEHVTNVLNYIIEKRDFPVSWSEGLRSAVYKAGNKRLPDNYRGITILPIFEKIFETAVYKRLVFVNEAFEKIDKWNGGFMHDSRTSDNLFILNGLIERQLLLGQPLYVCFVDFSKAFDMVNRDVLFYKLMKSGWKGRVIDTLRNLYSKTTVRVKHSGKIGEPFTNSVGVNQGGVLSGLLFRKYLADMCEYLKMHVGICIQDSILTHFLWADDLYLISNSVPGMQQQVDGLLNYASENHMGVNAIKTKCMGFGNCEPFSVKFGENEIEQVTSYKYLGNIARFTKMANQDIFSQNYHYLCDQARKAIFSMSKKLSRLGRLPPSIMFYLFDSMIKPILTYGSDVWGINKAGREAVDKVFLHFVRCTLGVKATTSNYIVYGESGTVPPSVYCTISALSFANRLHCMNPNRIVKQVYDELSNLDNLGYSTWVTKINKLANTYLVNFGIEQKLFKIKCKESVIGKFIDDWHANIADISKNPVLRTYALIKQEFVTEPYLYLVKNPKYRGAITRLRASSHILAIERGRYTRPKTPVSERLCDTCRELEDEQHFVMYCTDNNTIRQELFSKITNVDPTFTSLDNEAKFIYLFNNNDAQILTWFGKFLDKSFKIRSERAVITM